MATRRRTTRTQLQPVRGKPTVPEMPAARRPGKKVSRAQIDEQRSVTAPELEAKQKPSSSKLDAHRKPKRPTLEPRKKASATQLETETRKKVSRSTAALPKASKPTRRAPRREYTGAVVDEVVADLTHDRRRER